MITIDYIDVLYYKRIGSLIEGYLQGINCFVAYDMLFQSGEDISKHLHGKVKDTRLMHLKNFISNLEESSFVEKGDETLHIKLKPYQFSSGKDIFEKARMIWSNRGASEYHVDGMIFIPYNTSYPIRGGTWDRLFKWKPETLNSIDFLVKLVMNDKGEAKVLYDWR